MTDDMPPTDRNADRERSGRWLSAVLLVGVAGIAVRLVLDFGQPLFTDDIWWHLALGRVFLELGALPHAEPLLFTSQEHVQFYQEWMFELVVAALDRFGGQGLLRATHVIVAAAIFHQLYAFARAQKTEREVALAVVLTLALFAFQRLTQLRPHLFSILFFYLLLNLYCVPKLSYFRAASVVVVAALWANFHAIVLVVFPFLAIYAVVGEQSLRMRSWRHIWALFAALFVVVINPQGFRLYYFYFIHDANNSLIRIVDEWGRIFVVPRGFEHVLPWSSLPLLTSFTFVTLIFLVQAARMLRRNKGASQERHLPAYLIAWAAISLIAAALAVRFLWMMPLVVLAVARGTPMLAISRRFAQGALAAVILMSSLHLSYWGSPGYHYPLGRSALGLWISAHGTYGKFMPDAITAIENSGFRGNLYAPYALGGYASYRLYPKVRLFLNGRYDSYPRRVYDDHWLALQGGRSILTLIDNYAIDGFLLPVSGSYYKTVHSLQVLGWCRAYHGETAIWLLAPARAESVPRCLNQGPRVHDQVESLLAARRLRDALQFALKHHDFELANDIVRRPEATELVRNSRQNLGDLCALHKRLIGELNTETLGVHNPNARQLGAATRMCDFFKPFAAP